ncbi:Uma2 family endonuclease [Synechococcales cyanobacterium C]|uniref:Uma2 family endonuclease n=1 Tax=Petrachloros mirabilis ULC683 TaxID=2781853 RepID=A0A8K1ZWX4_9CYAN|nr:Uma2 family endonuclease [Petrachloros mirabilis]NCJ05378.1 Uma2 family endonuclease [Petrachloros mirabilis ULC683]
MVQLRPKHLTIRDFIDDYGDNPQYELIDGEPIDLEPTGQHEEVAGFIGRKLNVAIDQQALPYFIPYRCLIKLLGTETAFRPDVVVLDKTQLDQEPLWQQEPVICRGTSVKLVVEVVSSNWQNDYARKTEDYALLGIPEYWIVDYLGLGGRDYTGNPKQPTLTLCVLKGDRYQKQALQGCDRIQSRAFPSLQLAVDQIFTPD